MSAGAKEIDDYLATLPEPKRSTLETLRERILKVVPQAEQCISYGMPAFRVNGKVVAGFAAFKNHLAYLPHSGSILSELSDRLKDYKYTQGSLHFAVDECLDQPLIEDLISLRMAAINA